MTHLKRSWADEPRTRSLPLHTGRTTTMKHLTNSRRVATVAVASGAAIAMAGGVAYAVWSTSGTGTAAAQAGTVAPMNASVGTVSSSATLLYPGVSVPATINVHNPNSVAVKVTGYTISPAAQPSAVTTPANASCTVTTALVSVASATASGLSLSIPANGDLTITPAGTPVTMGANSDNGCQGATFTFSGVTVAAQVG